MANELVTRFVFDDKESFKVDVVHQKLLRANNDFNNLGKNATFGKTIADNFTVAGKEADAFKAKVDNAFQQPTISRYWQNESNKVVSSLKTVDAAFTNTKNLVNAGAESLKRIGEFKLESPQLGKPDNSLLQQIEKARLAAAEFNKQKIDAGKFDGLARAGVRLHDAFGRLQADVRGINSALSKTSDKTTIDALNQKLAVADDRFARLNSHLRQYEARQSAIGKTTSAGQTASKAGNFTGELGQGVLSGLGFAGSLGAAGAIAAGIITVKQFGAAVFDATTESEKRTNSLKASVFELGLSYDAVSNSVANYGRLSGQSLKDNQNSFVEILKLTNDTKTSADSLGKAVSEVAAKRSIDGEKLTGILENVNKGIADAAVFGQNGASVFDQYAASIGRTAESLTLAEKRQALSNELLKNGALNAGAASEKINTLTGKSEQLGKTWDNLLSNIGKNATPAVLAVLGLLDVATGGADPKSPQELAEIQRQNDAQKFKAYTDNFNKNKSDVADALKDPFGSNVNFAYSRFLNKDKFASGNLDVQNEALKKSIADANEFIKKNQGIIERAVAVKNVDYLKDVQATLKAQQNLYPPDVFRKLSTEVADAINEGTKQGFELSLKNPEKTLSGLRKLLSQVTDSKDLKAYDKQSLIFNITGQINQDIEKSKAKVEDFGKTARSIFDDVFGKTASDNPIAKVFFDGTTQIEKMRDSLRIMPAEMQKVGLSAVEMQKKLNLKNLYEARLDNRLGIVDLKQQAENFRNPFDPDESKREEETFIKRFLFNNPNYLFLKQSEYEQKNYLSNGLTAFESFDEYIRKDILKFAGNSLNTPKNRLNRSLDEKYNELFSNPFLTDEQKSVNERKFLSQLSGVNPLDLNSSVREKAAQFAENEAKRRADFEKETIKLDRERTEILREMAKAQKTALERAEKEGSDALKTTIEFIDRTNGQVKILGASPTPQDTAKTYDLGFSGGTNR